MPMVEILGVPFSNYVRSICIALEEKGVPYTLTPALAHSPEVYAIHPLGKIPCLRHDGFSLCESKAIVTYIDRTFPGPRLIPAEIKSAAQVEQWISLANTTLVPTFQGYAMGYFFPRTSDGEPDPAVITAATPMVTSHLKLLDRVLTGKTYIAADVFSYADISLLPILFFLRDLPESGKVIADSPALLAYLETHAQRPSFVATKPPPASELLQTTRAMAREMMAKAKAS